MTTPSSSLDPDLERALKTVGACLAAVEAHVSKKPPRRWWWWIAETPKWSPILTPIIVAGLAYYFSGYFQQTLDLQKLALEQRRVDLSGIGQMRELIAELHRENLTPGQAVSISLSLAAFGDLAGPSLIQAIETGHANHKTGAEVGLAAAGLADPGRVCPMLSRIVDNRTGLFNWQTQEIALRLIGQLGCIDETLSIEAFRDILSEGVDSYQRTVRVELGSHNVDLANLEALKKTARDALRQLNLARELQRARELQHDRVSGSGAGIPPASSREGAAD